MPRVMTSGTGIWPATGAAVIGAMLLPLVASAFTSAAAGAHDESPAQAVSVDAARLEEVRTFVDSERRRASLPGMSVAIVLGESLVFAEGFGEARVGEQAMTEDSVTLIASLSKSITALTLLTLVDEGLVELDDPVSTYIPETAPNGDQVTLRQLMHHRSGISTAVGNATHVDETGLSLERNGIRLGPLLDPDAGYEYSNTNYDALALVIERVTGRPFPEAVADRVFRPLGMASSSAGPAGAESPELAAGHYHRLFLGYGEHQPWMQAGMAGSSTMFSSARDIARLMMVHLGHSQAPIVSPQSLTALHEPAQYGPDDWPVGYAGGLHVLAAGRFPFPGKLAELTMLEHTGSSPSYRSAMAMLPDAGLGVVVLANGNDITNETAIPQIRDNIVLLLLGEPLFEVTALSDTLKRWGKHLLALVLAGQIALTVLSLVPLRRLRERRSPRQWGWAVLALAAVLDLVVVVLILVVIPSVGNAPIGVTRSLPDYGPLITGMMFAVGWGTLRTAAAAFWGLSERRAPEPRVATTAPPV